jgi:hypothetical protein
MGVAVRMAVLDVLTRERRDSRQSEEIRDSDEFPAAGRNS